MNNVFIWDRGLACTIDRYTTDRVTVSGTEIDVEITPRSDLPSGGTRSNRTAGSGRRGDGVGGSGGDDKGGGALNRGSYGTGKGITVTCIRPNNSTAKVFGAAGSRGRSRPDPNRGTDIRNTAAILWICTCQIATGRSASDRPTDTGHRRTNGTTLGVSIDRGAVSRSTVKRDENEKNKYQQKEKLVPHRKCSLFLYFFHHYCKVYH